MKLARELRKQRDVERRYDLSRKQSVVIAGSGGGQVVANNFTYITEGDNVTIIQEGDTIIINANAPRWEPLTNGNTVSPEILFNDDGDVLMVEVA